MSIESPPATKWVTEPFDGTAMAVFTTREAVDEFVAGDPFVLGGVVAGWTVRPWSELLGG